jgi:hypothetical protein
VSAWAKALLQQCAVSSLLDNLDAAKAKPDAPKALHEDD